jgi:hypothetical protein
VTSITAGTAPIARPARPALLSVIAAQVARRLATANARTRAALAVVLRLVLTVAALCGFTVSAWHTFGMGAGLAVGAVACLVLEYVVKR